MSKTLISNEVNKNGICPFSGNHCSLECMARVGIKEKENDKEVSRFMCALSMHIEQQIQIANHLYDIHKQLEMQNSHANKITTGLCCTTGFMLAIAVMKLIDKLIDLIF